MSATLTDSAPLRALPVEHIADLAVDLDPLHLIETPVGTRAVYIAKGGRIDGPELHGTLLPGGGDWLRLGSDLIGRVDVRTTIRTDDGVLIEYTASGLVQLPADGLARLAAGERVPWQQAYVRTTPRFETSDERYAWLSRRVMVAYNELSRDHVDYRIYGVL